MKKIKQHDVMVSDVSKENVRYGDVSIRCVSVRGSGHVSGDQMMRRKQSSNAWDKRIPNKLEQSQCLEGGLSFPY